MFVGWIVGWRFSGYSANPMMSDPRHRSPMSPDLKTMVGPRGVEPQTSTVSKRRDYVRPTTSKVLKHV
jgi:hypothetical protein